MEANFKNKRVLIIGLGQTGEAAALYFRRRSAHVTVSDHGQAEHLQTVATRLRRKGVKVELGEHRPADFLRSDLILLSPGVPHTLPLLAEARAQGTLVTGEIEFAAARVTAPIIAVTGSNGKTTTTALIGHLLGHAGYRVFVGGNIGNPLIAYLDQSQTADVVVLEISSFQLDTISAFCPAVAVLLNIQPDHLDRYADFNAYARAKARIFMNQTVHHAAILNGTDPEVQKLLPELKARSFLYASDLYVSDMDLPGMKVRPDVNPAGIIGPTSIQITLPEVNFGQPVCFDLAGVKLPGAHNRENMCAALMAAALHGAQTDKLRLALPAFAGLAHRLEEVRVLHQVRYINDSKATNVAATRVALAAFDVPLVVIMGGRPKGDDFTELKPLMEGRVKHLIALGEARRAIQDALSSTVPVEMVEDMDQAVKRSQALAVAGDIVLLSPACASFDMFDNYGHRGEVFRRTVQEL